MTAGVREALRARVVAAVVGAIADGAWPVAAPPRPVIEVPRDAAFGDFASPVALALAREARQPPLAVAEALAARLPAGGPLASAQAAAPGFLNLRVADAWLHAHLATLLRDPDGLDGVRAALGAAPRRDDPFGPEPPGAARETAENPAFYVAYTHARLAGIERLVAGEHPDAVIDLAGAPLDRLAAPEERALLLAVASAADEASAAVRLADDARLARYALALAAAFHRCFAAHRVLVDDTATRRARLALVTGTRRVLGAVLADGLRVEAPETL